MDNYLIEMAIYPIIVTQIDLKLQKRMWIIEKHSMGCIYDN